MSLRSFLKATAYLLLFSLCLGSIYREFSGWLQPAWLTVLCINSILAFVAYFRKTAVTAIRENTGKFRWVSSLSQWLLANNLRLYLPATVVFAATLLLPVLTRDHSLPFEFKSLGLHAFALVIWVPVAEELVFRRGFGLAFREWLGPLWGAYFSALFFALAHAQPTFYSLMNEGMGLALGPLLLGLGVEILYSLGHYRLGPCIALHAACNFSAVSFALIDPRWLDWLSLFYI